MANAWPRFVWVMHPTRVDYVKPEIWYQESHTSQHSANGKLIVTPYAAQHDLPVWMHKATVFELAETYPPPVGFKWRREPFVSLNPTKPLNTSDVAPISVEVEVEEETG